MPHQRLALRDRSSVAKMEAVESLKLSQKQVEGIKYSPLCKKPPAMACH
jgi:CRISPR/Cas system CMR-associated protein Cmr5 small subunit